MKAKNPKMFQQYEQLRKSNGNPQEILNQITSKYTPEQTKQFMQFANGFGITNEQLNQYGINIK